MSLLADYMAKHGRGTAVPKETTPPRVAANDSKDDKERNEYDFDAVMVSAINKGNQARKEDAKTAKEQEGVAQASAFRSLELVLDQHGGACVTSGSEAIPLESSKGLDYVRRLVYKESGKVVGDTTLTGQIGILRAELLEKNKRTPVYKRTAPHGDGFVIDRGNGNGIYVAPGHWEDKPHDGATLFMRGAAFGELPSPVRPQSKARAMQAINTIMGEMGIPEARRMMVIVALVNALRHGVPYVILLLIGGAGSGKSTTAGNLGGFIDPTTSGELPNVPMNAQDIAAVGLESHVIGFDNVSTVSTGASDMLCMITHGSEFVLREFHTRKGTTRLHVHCQIIMTAITNPATRGDLLDRVIAVTLDPHGDYKSEEEIRAWFREVQPVALGALVELLAAALAVLPSVRDQRRWTHRLVDFCQLGEAIVQVCGGKSGDFLEQFHSMRKDAAEDAASGDPVIQHVLDVVRGISDKADEASAFPSWRRWSGEGFCAIREGDRKQVAIKASTLRLKVRARASMDNSRSWMPESDKAMSDVLLQKKPTLAAVGIDVTRQCFNGDSGAAWVFGWEG